MHAISVSMTCEFQLGPGTVPISGGEFTRRVLLVLTKDPEMQESIEVTAAGAGRSAQVFDFGATNRITVVVLLVL
jgi:hypothetical protein